MMALKIHVARDAYCLYSNKAVGARDHSITLDYGFVV